MQSIVKYSLDRFLKLGLNESRYHGSIECFLLRETRNLCGLIIPFVDIAMNVDSENWSIGSIDQLSELIGHGRNSSIVLRRLGHILCCGKYSNVDRVEEGRYEYDSKKEDGTVPRYFGSDNLSPGKKARTPQNEQTNSAT